MHIFLGHISLPLRSPCCDLADAGDDHEATCDDDDDDEEENNYADDDGNTIEAWKRRFGSGLVSPPVHVRRHHQHHDIMFIMFIMIIIMVSSPSR